MPKRNHFVCWFYMKMPNLFSDLHVTFSVIPVSCYIYYGCHLNHAGSIHMFITVKNARRSLKVLNNTPTQLTWMHPQDLVVPLSAAYFINTCKTACVQVHQIKNTAGRMRNAVQCFELVHFLKTGFCAETPSITLYMVLCCSLMSSHWQVSSTLHLHEKKHTCCRQYKIYVWCLAASGLENLLCCWGLFGIWHHASFH